MQGILELPFLPLPVTTSAEKTMKEKWKATEGRRPYNRCYPLVWLGMSTCEDGNMALLG